MASHWNAATAERVPVPIDDKDYDSIIAEIAELIYRAACEAELKAASRPLNKKDTSLPPPMATFLKQGEQNAI